MIHLAKFVNDSLEGLIYKLQGVCEEVKSMMLPNIYRILEVIIFPIITLCLRGLVGQLNLSLTNQTLCVYEHFKLQALYN